MRTILKALKLGYMRAENLEEQDEMKRSIKIVTDEMKEIEASVGEWRRARTSFNKKGNPLFSNVFDWIIALIMLGCIISFFINIH